MYGRCGLVFSVREVFYGLQKKNVVVWIALMTAHVQRGCFEETSYLFKCMNQEDILPNKYTFAVLLNACAGIASSSQGDIAHAQVEKLGLKNHVIVRNALIDMYSKSGSIDLSYNVFSYMIYRDIISWNAMICGYSRHGVGKQSLLVFQDMVSAGECPNYVTFIGVLSACDHLGLVQEGFYYLNQVMKKFKIEPGLEHYTCMVSLLCRAGMLDEAENFMKTTQVEWDVVAWTTLLNACRIHQNYVLGKQIAESILQMDPHDMGTYTLLSNMYAKASRWDEVKTIRKLMRERNNKKEPGVSWLEIANEIYVFFSEDINHPEFIQIHKLLKMIQEIGDVPNIAELHDTEDEQGL